MSSNLEGSRQCKKINNNNKHFWCWREASELQTWKKCRKKFPAVSPAGSGQLWLAAQSTSVERTGMSAREAEARSAGVAEKGKARMDTVDSEDLTCTSHQNTAWPKREWDGGGAYWITEAFEPTNNATDKRFQLTIIHSVKLYFFLWTKESHISKSHASWLNSVLIKQAHK